MGYLLGIDVGTTNTKAVLYDPEAGRVVAVGRCPTLSSHPRPEWTEYEADTLWRGVVGAIRQATADRAADVDGVAVASMAEAGVPIGSDGRYLYPIIAWHDPRTEPQANWWQQRLGARAVFRITGQNIQAKFSINKLLWLRQHHPDTLELASRWLCVSDLVTWKLSGEFATDFSIASRTMAFDQGSLDWSEEILSLAGISRDLFPTAYPAGTSVGVVTRAAGAETGLRPGTLVVTGGHDHLCGALAVGAAQPGTVLDSIGTAESCLIPTGVFNPDERLREAGIATYSHVVRGAYVVMCGLSASGGLLEWLVSQLWTEVVSTGGGLAEALTVAIDAAGAVSPGADGLFCLPDLAGAGSPRYDELSKGALVGLTRAHGRGHMIRAALESTGYWLRENIDWLRGFVEDSAMDEIVAIGAAARSPVCMQIRADIIGRPVRVPDLEEAVAVGAALLAGLGTGHFENEVSAAASVCCPVRLYEPNLALSGAYDAYYQEIYLKLYPALRALNHRMHESFWGGGELGGKGT